jgi:aminomethyltransferase
MPTLAHVQAHLSNACEIEPMFSRGLLALQGAAGSRGAGPAGAAGRDHEVHDRRLLRRSTAPHDYVTRSGYTGGDGYEISTPATAPTRSRASFWPSPK